MKEWKEPMLKIHKLNKQYGDGCEKCQRPENRNLDKNYCKVCGTVFSCQDIDVELWPGEVLGIVGESGSGKSTLMKCIYFDQDVTSGELYLSSYQDGKLNVLEASAQQKKMIRNEYMGMVYQNPIHGLRMNFTSVGNIAEKMIAAGNRHVETMESRGKELLDQVNIPLFRMMEEPKNFSGGMQQRVQIAKALSNRPPILLLDEVTTGLDLSVQADVLDLVKQLQRELNIGMILVSHDLGVIRMMADRTMVMLDGKVVERGLTDQILEDPQHIYTQQLVHSLL